MSMELNNFIENFGAQFDDIDSNDLTPETFFKELPEWSSMISLSIIAMVDEEYNIQIKGVDIREAKTISDLFNRIAQYKS